MRPLFRLPGIAGFIVTMGFISGYPVAARLSSQLYEQKQISARQAERLICFTTTSDPIFLIGAVSIGFFHSYTIALIFSIVHYGTAIILGLLLSLWDREPLGTLPTRTYTQNAIWKEALLSMHKARVSDLRTDSQIYIDAISVAIRLMIIVGGLVVFFSVILQLLTSTHALSIIIATGNQMLAYFGLPTGFIDALVPALFEVTLGTREASIAPLPLIHQAAVGVWALSFAGLSVHAQVASLISHTPISYIPFLKFRFVHACLSSLALYIVWPIFI